MGEQEMDGGAKMVTSPTGGNKGEKMARFDLIPQQALWALAEHYGRGEQKYPTEGGIPNFRRGYDFHLSYAALMRHASLFWQGEDIDPETGSHHMIAVAWHALALFQNQHDFGALFDDRMDAEKLTDVEVGDVRPDFKPEPQLSREDVEDVLSDGVASVDGGNTVDSGLVGDELFEEVKARLNRVRVGDKVKVVNHDYCFLDVPSTPSKYVCEEYPIGEVFTVYDVNPDIGSGFRGASGSTSTWYIDSRCLELVKEV